MKKINYGAKLFERDVEILAQNISLNSYSAIYGVPRGGIPLACALSQRLNIPLVTDPPMKRNFKRACLIVDDVVDSGRTRMKYKDFDFVAIHVKKNTPPLCYPTLYAELIDGWVDYFWETNDSSGVEDNIVRMIQYIGDDPLRSGMLETPARVVKSWKEIFAGYDQSPKDVFKTFDDEREDFKFGGLVYLKNIEFYSTCEHHWLPFLGTAFIAYIPNGPVIGTSKMARLLDIYARRFQMQERIGEQVTKDLMEHLNPIGAACLIEAKHLCIACRGVKKQHSEMGYSSLKGVFLEQTNAGIAARNELMALWARR
jgi:GTP cyclohydrolase I